MAVKGKVSQKETADYPLSFNDITGYKPGDGRGSARKGLYINTSGNILVVYSKDTALVDSYATSSGKTRTGMAMFDAKRGCLRPVKCDDGKDGDKRWKVFAGSIELGHATDVPGNA